MKEITLDIAGSMKLITKRCFPNAVQVIDRFHVQKLSTKALQEIRISHRWQAIDQENRLLSEAKEKKTVPVIEVFENGDTPKKNSLHEADIYFIKPETSGLHHKISELKSCSHSIPI